MSNSRSGGTRTCLERIRDALNEIEYFDSEESRGEELCTAHDVEKIKDLIHEMLKDVV